MRLLLVRHGESVCNVSGVVGGDRGCTGLTDCGREQAHALAARFEAGVEPRPDVLLASTLPRAVETGTIVGNAIGMSPVLDADLREMDPGEADGGTWEHWRENNGFDPGAEPDRLLAPGGDSVNSFRRRVGSLLERLAFDHDGKTVVAACHGGIAWMSFMVTFGVSDTVAAPYIQADHTSITEWTRPGGRWNLIRFNDTAHLRHPAAG